MKYNFFTPYEELSETLKAVVTANDSIDVDLWNKRSYKWRLRKCREVLAPWIGKLTQEELDYLTDCNRHTARKALEGK